MVCITKNAAVTHLWSRMNLKKKVDTKICEDRRFGGYELHEHFFGRLESEE